MSDLAGFSIDDLTNPTTVKEGGEAQEVKVDQIMSKLRRLLQGKMFLEEEIKETQSLCDSLQTELATLQKEAHQLEENHKEKEDLCRKLQFQRDKSEQDSARQLEQNKKRDELLEQYRCEIQEIELKQRKQRMKFENQLLQLIEQHKNLYSVFSQQSLPDEIRSAENTKIELLATAQAKLAQLDSLDDELGQVKKQKQQVTAPAET